MESLQSLAEAKILKNQNERISSDVKKALNIWLDKKQKWFENTISRREDSVSLENNRIITDIHIIAPTSKSIEIGFTMMNGRLSSQFYRMLNKSFTKYVNDKIVRAIERKYLVKVTVLDTGNHNPNPEIKFNNINISNTKVSTKL